MTDQEEQKKQAENLASEPEEKSAATDAAAAAKLEQTAADSLTAELEQCRKDRDHYLDGWRRAKADLLNFKKEENERIKAAVTLIQSEVISEILSIVDSFERGLALWSGESEEKNGMKLVFQKFESTLKKLGVEAIVPKIGEPFDPATEECVAATDGGPPGAIAEVLEKGYLFKGKVIKTAKVKVVK